MNDAETSVAALSVWPGSRGAGMRAPAGRLRGWLERATDRALGLTALQTLYLESARRPEPHFVDRALAVLDVTWTLTGDLTALPASGPLIAVANHPTGGLDGLLLASVLLRRRPDVRLLANVRLTRVHDLRDLIIPVDPYGGPAATVFNRRPLRETVRWLRGGGCLGVFPAGDVSHAAWRGGRPTDGSWHETIGRLLHLTDATAVTVHLDLRASAGLRLARVVHPALHTALLPREILRQRHQRVIARVGAPVEARALGPDGAATVASLRARTEQLAMQPPAAAEVEIAECLSRRTLLRSDGYAVFWARGDDVPAILQTIGLERERTFRAAGEGTGLGIDLDRFDGAYLHLCLWNERAGELAGAYRMREVCAETRPADLYTRTLFAYDERFIRTVGPALELGRAFVRPTYQRQYAPLMLLWSGIGRYLASRPDIRTLFGAVSMDADYGAAARVRTMTWLRHHAWNPGLAALVDGLRPPPDDGPAAPTPGAPEDTDIMGLSAAIAKMDVRGRGVPVLLRQYLKLRAQAVGFSLDPAFSNVLDTLVVVDVARIPAGMRRRFIPTNPARMPAPPPVCRP